MTDGDRGRAEPIVLRRGSAVLTVDPARGGRFASLTVEGHELLVTAGDGPIWWGCYPMAPFAGRVRDGRFVFRDRVHALPLTMPPNAIHGTVLDRAWTVVGHDDVAAELTIDLGPDWPFRGRLVQVVGLVDDGLEATLELIADEPMPAVLGWHPWFRRSIGGSAAELGFEARAMYVRGPDGLPTGATAPPTPRPWDDAFTDLVHPPLLVWPDVLALELRSTAPTWVVFDERAEAICVEPQTAPPDAFNLAAAVGVEPPLATPDRPAAVAMAWRWTSLRPARPVRPSKRRRKDPAR